MTGIDAFVGHSFTVGDAEIVAKFEKYFDQLKHMLPNFRWVHAESAEPKLLSEKVLSLMDGKNVFIGICTKKERVAPETLHIPWLWKDHLSGLSRDFVWKTSDWIIQEIGLATGRGLSIILLLEEGVRTPGGIQSDVEYIVFNRQEPEKAFGKIVEMFGALTPKVTTTALVTSAPEDADQRIGNGDVDSGKPQPNWSQTDFDFAIVYRMLREDHEDAERVNQAYLTSQLAQHGDQAATWQAHYESLKIRFGKGGSLATLESMAVAHPTNPKILSALATCFESYDEFSKAAESYKKAADASTEEKQRFNLLGRAILSFEKSSQPTQANAIRAVLRESKPTSKEVELALLLALKNDAEHAEDEDAALAVMERILDVDPSDTDTRFQLAYKYSQQDSSDVALFHYLRIPPSQRTPMTWNNIGAALGFFSISGRSMEALRIAEAEGETLAMSNVAKRYISGGFFPEAQKLLTDASHKESPHKNVARYITELSDLPDEEEKKEKGILEKARPKSTFYKEFGIALSRSLSVEIDGQWVGPTGSLNIEIRDGHFSARGTFERDTVGSLFALQMPGIGRAKAKEKVQIIYAGVIKGRAIRCEVERRSDGPPSAIPATATILGLGTDLTKVLLVVSDTGQTISAMERRSSGEPTFYELTRSAPRLTPPREITA